MNFINASALYKEIIKRCGEAGSGRVFNIASLKPRGLAHVEEISRRLSLARVKVNLPKTTSKRYMGNSKKPKVKTLQIITKVIPSNIKFDISMKVCIF